MELKTRIVSLELAETFTIARGSQDVADVVEIEIRHEGMSGFGEATPQDVYDESIESAQGVCRGGGAGPRRRPLCARGGDGAAAADAVRGAGGDRRRAARPLRQAARRAGLAAARAGACRAADRLDDRPGRSRHDGAEGRARRRERAVQATEAEARRRATGSTSSAFARSTASREVPLQVDVNEYWTFDEALDALPQLEELGVEYCEQPLRHGDDDGTKLKAASPIPIFVDEDCHTLKDVAECAGIAHGINIKLAKSGGIREAVRMAHTARALGLGVMLGCMVESGLGIAPGAAIASLCDYIDLDGNLLIAHDPWPGVELVDGVQTPSEEPGLGVRQEVPSPR